MCLWLGAGTRQRVLDLQEWRQLLSSYLRVLSLQLLWMPLCSLPLPACSVGISYAWQGPLQMKESPSTPQSRGFALPLLML